MTSLGLAYVAISTAGGGGLWFVIRLIRNYQRDFTDEYAQRITRLEARIEVLEQDKQTLSRSLIACATERAMLRAVVKQAGIQWDPADWGAIPE